MDISMQSSPVASVGSFATKQLSGAGVASAAIEAQLSTQFLVDPTALPQVASDSVNTGPIPPGVQAPKQPAPAPPAASSAAPSKAAPSAATSKAALPAGGAAKSSQAPARLVTVTVTEHADATATVTVTALPSAKGSSTFATTTTTSTKTVIPVAAKSSSAALNASGTQVAHSPKLTPFLAPLKRSIRLRGRLVEV